MSDEKPQVQGVDWNLFIDLAMKMSQDDLRNAYAILGKRWDLMMRRARSRFYIGQDVHFTHDGLLHEGKVMKINKKTIGVAVDFVDGQPRPRHIPREWRVGPTALKETPIVVFTPSED